MRFEEIILVNRRDSCGHPNKEYSPHTRTYCQEKEQLLATFISLANRDFLLTAKESLHRFIDVSPVKRGARRRDVCKKETQAVI